MTVFILQVCEYLVKSSRYGFFCGSVGSESRLVRIQAGRHVVIDVVENQLLKALHQDGVGSHRVVVIKTRHSRLFRYRNYDGCCETGVNSLL